MPEAVERPHRTFWGFTQRYCRTKDNGFGLQIIGGRNLEELCGKLADGILRRKKDDVLPDLPPLRLDTLFIDGIITRELSVLSDDLRGQIEAALEADGVSGLSKLAPHVAQLRRLTGLCKVEGVVETVNNELLADGKIVLGAYHRDVINALYDGLKSWGCVIVDGSTPSSQRTELVDQFQVNPHCRVFIGQMTAAGTGLTLTAASETIIVEPSWVPAENEQFAMRIHRIGQRNACRVRFATLANSLDEKINRAVIRKTADIIQLFN
jgi:SNF2 family DNA or RNA helicase